MRLRFTFFLLCVSNILYNIVRVAANQGETDYCNISSCDDPEEHVMCLYKKATVGEACVNYQPDKGFSDAEKRAILRAHNEFRSAVAIGAMSQRTPNGQEIPSAEDMSEMFWDNELEMFAKRWAMQCKVFRKDECRNTKKYPNVGQLLFRKTWDPSSPLTYHVNSAYLRAGPASTVLPLMRKRAEKIPYREQRVLAQIIWANADRLGCARVVFDRDPTVIPKKPAKIEGVEPEQASVENLSAKLPGSKPATIGGVSGLDPSGSKKSPPRVRRKIEATEFVVCNYNDGGIMNGSVYREGKFCTYCFCSTDYPGLCAGGNEFVISTFTWMAAILLVLLLQ